MEHHYAVKNHLVEQYLLNDMSPEERDAFEEHFFDCTECAMELRATNSFLHAARAEFLRTHEVAVIDSYKASQPKSTFKNILTWRPAFAVAALAACLVVMVYQNVVTVPHLRNQIASVDVPAVLPSLSLVSGNSRGGSVPEIALNGARSLVLQVDIPTEDRYSGYTCSLYTPQNQLIWTVPVSAEQAKNTVSIRAPITSRIDGTYLLKIQANQNQSSTSLASIVNLANYPFTISGGTGTAGK
jgi:hypothetical protein